MFKHILGKIKREEHSIIYNFGLLLRTFQIKPKLLVYRVPNTHCMVN
jgi:hypothetical protein